jgi:hypothetical protein
MRPFDAADRDAFGPGRLAPAWQGHSEALDSLFDHFTVRYAVPFARWAKSNANGGSDERALFYPFSGPDITFAHLLRPNAKSYILCGLEPCGDFPDQTRLNDALLLETLPRITSSLRHFLCHSYFITQDLRRHLQIDLLPGVLPVLLVLLCRAGCRVISIDFFRLEASEPDANASTESVPGLHIEFASGRTKRQLYYFQQDLRDTFFSRRSPVFCFIADCGRPVIFSKSASYLLHEPDFSNIRRLIFRQGSVLVQDPSCMPFQLLADRGWSVDLYGHYTKTLPVFKKYEQPDLARAYEGNSAAEPLPFAIGYLADPHTTSLMVAGPGARKQRVRNGSR